MDRDHFWNGVDEQAALQPSVTSACDSETLKKSHVWELGREPVHLRVLCDTRSR